MTTKINEEEQTKYEVTYKRDSSLSEENVISWALEILASRANKSEALTSPADTKKYLQVAFADRKQEVFSLLLLDNKHKQVALVELFYGTIDGASVYPREVIRAILDHNASAVVLCHNHPSGDVSPSRADFTITNKIIEAVNSIDVRALDHIIVGYEGTYSFAENGEM